MLASVDPMRPIPGTPLRLFVSMGLRVALRAHCAALPDSSPRPALTFGRSHMLAQRIAAGEWADAFISTRHAEALARPGEPPLCFATDRLIAASRPEIGLRHANFLDRLLDPRVRLGTATPGATTSGDLAERLFDAAERLHPGAAVILRQKSRNALAASDPEGPAWTARRAMDLLASGECDIVLACNSGLRGLATVADIVFPPPGLEVDAVCEIVALAQDPPRREAVHRFASGLLSDRGRENLQRHGYAPTQPAERVV